MSSTNITNRDLILTYEKITLVVDYINYVLLFTNTMSLICFVWLSTSKAISGVMGAYRWYLLSQTISYSLFHVTFTAWQFVPLPAYTTNNGTTIYMYCASALGVFKTWQPSNMLTNSLANLVNFIILFAMYNFFILFIYRYCQTLGNRFCEFLSSRKSFIMHIGGMCFVSLFLIPTNAASEEEMQEYKDHMEPLLRELMKDYAFYGIKENTGWWVILRVFEVLLITSTIFTGTICVALTYRFLYKNKISMSQSTYTLMHTLIKALSYEALVIVLTLGVPGAVSFLYELVDPSIKASIVKRICFNMPSLLTPLTDIFQLIYIPLFRKEIVKKLRHIRSKIGSFQLPIIANNNGTWAEHVNSNQLQLQ